uniref:F-box/WD repeat-containing protein 4-like isoform X1 n=1 Tax=Styela clava TaxID=7725 RepID=UPI001939745A|nr:F-box/WD repeat-containing protein 4-like isoform X1 [Styela clava]
MDRISCLASLQPTAKINLNELPVDVLIIIFHYLDEKSLRTIAKVCHYFNEISSSNEIWQKWMKTRIMTSSDHGLNMILCPKFKEQCRLSIKWRQGRRKEKTFTKFEKNYLPWLAYHQDEAELYLAQGDAVKKYSSELWLKAGRLPVEKYDDNQTWASSTVVHEAADVCRFCLDDNLIITGGWHGKLSWASLRDLHFITKHDAHSADVSDVGIVDDVIISGSRDHTVKIWKLSDNMEELGHLFTQDIGDNVLSIATNKFRRIFAVGSGGTGGTHPLQIRDIESSTHLYNLGHSYKNGSGVLDCHFQSPNLLMSTGYDTYIRLWDIRTSYRECVRSWEEPHDNTVYCVTSDCRYGFVSGSCRHGVTRLWDTRMKNCLQTFYLAGKVSSPVYSVRFTHTHLFAALARRLVVLDFR